MELYAKKFKYNQDGKDYILTTGIVDQRIRIGFLESLNINAPFYSNYFTLEDLRMANQFFMLTPTINDALIEVNKGIERQKSAISRGASDTINFQGFLVIGTDNDMYTLPLYRDYEPNKYGAFNPPPVSPTADLILPTHYPIDAQKLKYLEMGADELERFQNTLEKEAESVMLEMNKLKKDSLDLSEENALLKERLNLLKAELSDKKVVVEQLLFDNNRIKIENENLRRDILYKESILREKQKMQTMVKLKRKPNLVHGNAGLSQEFENRATKTFLTRGVAKQLTDEYIGPEGGIQYEYSKTNIVANSPAPTVYMPTQVVRTFYNPILIKQPVQVYTPNNIIVPGKRVIYKSPTTVFMK